jgi:hypothetical protein
VMATIYFDSYLPEGPLLEISPIPFFDAVKHVDSVGLSAA